MQVKSFIEKISWIPAAVMLLLPCCNTLPFFEDEPSELPCGAPEEDTGAVRICPGGFPWCSCISRRCARIDVEHCESGFVHKDGTCLSHDETSSIKSSTDFYHPTCLLTCSRDIGCDDGAICNGQESCVEGFCVSGVNSANDMPCELSDGDTGVCRNGRCARLSCGDSHVDVPDEQCDDGNEDENDDCRSDCLWTCFNDAECSDDEPCNGIETCDVENHLCFPGRSLEEGVPCSRLGIVGSCRSGRCIPEECGNRVVEQGEQCDDGNASDNDACLMNCMMNTCGDGYVHAGVEECDDGNSEDGDGCDTDCRWGCLTDEECRMSGICRTCDRQKHACSGPALPDGQECDRDGDYMTLEVCSGGECVSAE